MVRIKMNLAEVSRYGNGGGGRIIMYPVVGGDTEENRLFWESTPNGKLELYIDNEEAFKALSPFGEYYIDIKKVE